MGKQIATYRSYSTATLKARTSVAYNGVTEGTGYIDCTNLASNAIETALGVDITPNPISTLCTHANINHWSAFGPTTRSVSGGVLVNAHISGNYSEGYFAGYNHNAVAPHFDSGGSTYTFVAQSGESHYFTCIADIGEILHTDVSGADAVTHVCMSVWNGATYLASQSIALSSLTNVANFSTTYKVEVTNITATATYTCKITFNSGSYDYQDGNLEYQLSELPNWTVYGKVAAGNHVYINAPYNDSSAYGSTFTSYKWSINSASFYTADGTLDFNSLQVTDWGYSNAHITAHVEEGYFSSGTTWVALNSYSAYDHIYNGSFGDYAGIGPLGDMVVWPGSTPVPGNGYGYRVSIDVNPS